MDGQSGVSPPKTLQDTFGRTFPYVRLSITDVCNFRCQYCLPNGYRCSGSLDFLRLDEIGRLVAALAALGVRKIRLTGGEPTVRSIRSVSMTTNGVMRCKLAAHQRLAGYARPGPFPVHHPLGQARASLGGQEGVSADWIRRCWLRLERPANRRNS